MAKFAEGGVVSGGNILWHSDVAETIIPPEKIRNILGLDDIVQVVRCKDCKHFYMGRCNHAANGWLPSREDNDFCSYGERREGE